MSRGEAVGGNSRRRGETEFGILGDQRLLREVSSPGARHRIQVAGDVLGVNFADCVRLDELSGAFGRFIVVEERPEEAAVRIVTDRYGLFPLYRRRGTSDFALSADRLAMRSEERRLDVSTLADLVALNTPLGNGTLIAGIETVPPGSVVDISLDDGAAQTHRAWSSRTVLLRQRVPLASVMDELTARFLEGVAYAVENEDVAVTLSGGVDSRCLLAAARHVGARPIAVNCSVPGSRSARYAARMAALTDTPYSAFPVDAEFGASYGERLESVLTLTGGTTFSSEVECHSLREQIRDATVVLHGAFGELSKLDSMHTYWVDESTRRVRRDQLADLLFHRRAALFARASAAFRPEVRRELERVARSNLRARIDAIEGVESTDDILQILYIEDFLGKVFRGSSVVWNDRIKTRAPFAYPPFIDLLLTVRNEDRLVQKLQMELLRRTSKTLRQFPDANTGLPIGAPDALIRAVGLVDKARRVLTRSKVARDHSDLRTWLTSMRPPIDALVDEADETLLDRGAIRRLIAQLRGQVPTPLVYFGPIGEVRRRIAQYEAAAGLEKALMVQKWLSARPSP